MVKYVPEVSSWQLLFVRCSMQVRIKSGDLRKVEVLLAIPQLVTMLPLVCLSGQNIMGTPDLATRYLLDPKFLVHLGVIRVLKLRWRVVAQGILGGFLLLTIFEAVSRCSQLDIFHLKNNSS